MMDIVYRSGSATASDVLEQLPDPPSYSAVRTTLRILEDKGLLKHEQDVQKARGVLLDGKEHPLQRRNRGLSSGGRGWPN